MNVIVKKCGENQALYTMLEAKIGEESCDFGVFSVQSRDLATHLKGCKRVWLFAATIGVSIDREIQKYSKISPHRALELQREGTMRIEAWCDAICAEFAKEKSCRTRYSPGYGDLSTDVQREIFRILEPAKRIGLCLSDSLLMSPSKSVTAFVGVEE